MRLQVEHQLQAVLDLTKKSISIVKNAIFQIGQAARFLQRQHRLEGVALAYAGQVAPVEQLQKLNGELDVTDAAVPGLDLGVALAELSRFLLDPALDGLDLTDLGDAEILR